MEAQREFTITWVCSRFSGEEMLRMNISPALLYLPWRMSCTFTPSLSKMSLRKNCWVARPVSIYVPPWALPIRILSATDAR